MEQETIIRKMNKLLLLASQEFALWLEKTLSKVTDTWWNDCVLPSLTRSQKEMVQEQGISKLSEFSLASLLRIADRSWYDIRTAAILPIEDRECIREMKEVWSRWTHCGTELPGRDTVLHDLETMRAFFAQLGGNRDAEAEIAALIRFAEEPGNIPPAASDSTHETEDPGGSSKHDEMIAQNSLVYPIGMPDQRGVVLSVSQTGSTVKYNVFIDGAIRTFYAGQIASAEEKSAYHWVNADIFRSILTAYQINNPSSQNLYSLNAARIDFVPYQFRPALKLIRADKPRILIADSVGVGKTIEAGLIMKELEARDELNRIMIICPRPLVAERKWELEMKRFDEEFIPMDGAMFREAIADTRRDGDWPVRYNKIIVPYSIMDSRSYNGSDEGRGRIYGLKNLETAPHFDLVIVDEAHHIRNGSMKKEKAFAYKCVKYFCDNADAVVMLTATPLQTGNHDLYTLLNLLRPDVVLDEKAFNLMAEPNACISQCAHIIRQGKAEWKNDAMRALLNVRKTQWGSDVISENPLYEDILERLQEDNPDREARVQLISDVESLNSFSTMLNRTRRRDIQDFCIRRTYTAEVEFTEDQKRLYDALLEFEREALSVLHNAQSIEFMISMLKRQAASCIFGLAPNIRSIINRRFQQITDDSEFEFDEASLDPETTTALMSMADELLCMADNLPEKDPKFERMLELVEQKQALSNNKIMLFSTFRHTLAYLKDRLRQRGIRVEQVDGSVRDEQRYMLKERFALPKENPDALDMLLFTEVGSEGLDYQFCNMMINYDLPWNPMRIEQRIGRIDRRGQKSEAVTIYNMITADTVDADIYYRCLLRIGIFEKSLGECDDILGDIASEISSIAMNPELTESERREKLDQIADNRIRQVQEMNRLEDAEKELFGFDFSEFSTAQEIQRAENPWLTPKNLEDLINRYLQERLGSGRYILGESAKKTLRLSRGARDQLLNDLKRLPGNRNAVRRSWESYLGGKTPKHTITFEAPAAEEDRTCFFITAMHPLAKQAAKYFESGDTVCISLEYASDNLPAGTYLFSVYAWKYLGLRTSTRLVVVCEEDSVGRELTDILPELTESLNNGRTADQNWTDLEERHIEMWETECEKHRADTHAMIDYRLKSVESHYRAKTDNLKNEMREAENENIRQMKQGEIKEAEEECKKEIKKIREEGRRADIHTALIANGVITIKGETGS